MQNPIHWIFHRTLVDSQCGRSVFFSIKGFLNRDMKGRQENKSSGLELSWIVPGCIAARARAPSESEIADKQETERVTCMMEKFEQLMAHPIGEWLYCGQYFRESP